MRRQCLFALLMLVCVLPLQAAHITDKLVVGLYEKSSLEGEPLQLLTSGMPVEVLVKKDEVAQVRLADDTKGWIEAGYVTDEKPASMVLLETQAELRQLKQNGTTIDSESAQLQLELDAARERIARLEQGQADLLAARMAQQKLEDLRERVQQAVNLLGAQPSPSISEEASEGLERYLVWIVGAIALIVGFAAGMALIDYRVRKKFGGIRI